MEENFYLYNEESKDLVFTEGIETKEYYESLNYIVVQNSFAENIIQKEKNSYKILELKQKLKETDWMITVNSELLQQGLEVKYPNIHNERQSWRDEINELEKNI